MYANSMIPAAAMALLWAISSVAAWSFDKLLPSPPQSFPSAGKVDFRSYCRRYFLPTSREPPNSRSRRASRTMGLTNSTPRGGGGEAPILARDGFNRGSHRVDFAEDPAFNDRRRAFMGSLFLSSAGVARSASAAEGGGDSFGAPATGLTRRVRTGIVRGAQLMDRVDGKWERFSDDLGLGAQRNRPRRNVIDAGGNAQTKDVVSGGANQGEPPELDEKFAYGLLDECDEVFLACLESQSGASIREIELKQRVNETKDLVRKSFFAAASEPAPSEAFNFECYAHFKTYNDILVAQKVNFPPFRGAFESSVGSRILALASWRERPSPLRTPPPSAEVAESVACALRATDAIAAFLLRSGLISSWERSVPPGDEVEDFTGSHSGGESLGGSPSASELPYSLALNGDVTLGSQLLLQELGYRLYPSFGRWMVGEGALRCFAERSGSAGRVEVQVDDYYMDTAYNSNPKLFEVKQVLLNIVIHRDCAVTGLLSC